MAIISLKTSKAKAITSPLIKVSGGDWRNTTNRSAQRATRPSMPIEKWMVGDIEPPLLPERSL
jgi:hypothetical protein